MSLFPASSGSQDIMHIETGVKNTTSSDGSISVTFERSFSNPPTVFCSPIVSSGTVYCGIVKSVSTTGFTAVIKTPSGSAYPSGNNVYWVALDGGSHQGA